MTESQRIGQLFMVGLAGDALGPTIRDAILDHHIGSVWFAQRTWAGRAALRAVSDAVQALATEGATTRVGFFIAANQEGGTIQALNGPGFEVMPSAVVQGTLALATLTVDAARWGRQLRAAGVNMDFAPVADVVPAGTASANAPIGGLDRQFGSAPATVASHVAAFVAGMRQAGVATSLKHFPGLGRVTGNTDVTAGVADVVTSRKDSYLAPFERGIASGAPAVMVSLATYARIDPDRLAAFSEVIIEDVLRHDLGFSGLVLSDSLSATAVEDVAPGARAIEFLGAGGDMIVVDSVATAGEMIRALADAASTSPSLRSRIDTAAASVLRAKEAAGLLPCPG